MRGAFFSPPSNVAPLKIGQRERMAGISLECSGVETATVAFGRHEHYRPERSQGGWGEKCSGKKLDLLLHAVVVCLRHDVVVPDLEEVRPDGLPMSRTPLSESELEVLKLLWELGPSTVRDLKA